MSAVAYDRSLTRSMNPRQHAAADRELLTSLTTYVGDEERLLDRARRTASPSELVIASVQLHQRNLQRRLREAAEPRDAFDFVDPESVGERILSATDGTDGTDETHGIHETHETHVSLDRIDRLSLLRSLTDSGSTGGSELPPAVRELGVGGRESGEQHVEQIRSEVESMTNFHPTRVDALRNATSNIRAPIDDEADSLIDGGIAIETALRERTSKAVSKADLLRRATRYVDGTDGGAWQAAFPEIDRVSFVGVSSVSAPYVDLLHAMLAATDVSVEIHLRPGTEAFLDDRLPELLAIDGPGREVFA